jgi:hypothetical protein
MAINFFESKCKSVTREKVFGIYDVPPAKLDFEDSDIWNVWVDNDKEIEISFIVIDGCVEIPHSEGGRCEGMLTYNDTLIFIELKDRGTGRWAGKARDQLINTILLFKRDVGLTGYRRLYGHIANKQRPYFKSGGKAFSQEFEDKTGFILRVSNFIKID